MRKAFAYFVLLSFFFASPAFSQSSGAKLSSDQLQKLVAPIALYPDPLLAQVLPASTYPLEIVDAARVVKSQSDESKIDSQNWDPSVKAVAHYPSVLQMMNNKLDWTQQLGQAVMNQQPDVLAAVQALRAQAKKQGNLKTTPQQNVSDSGSNIVIVPSDPQVVYVPSYDPTVIYTTPAPAYPLMGFGAGFAMGAWMSMGFAWGGGWGGGAIVNNYNWNSNNINSNNVKNWENNHPNATNDAKNAENNWSHDNSRGGPFGGGTNNSLGDKGGDSPFSKGGSANAADAQKSNYQNFENQMKSAENKDAGNSSGGFGGDKGRSANGVNPMADHSYGGGDRDGGGSMFGSGRSADQSMADSSRGFDSRGGGGFGGMDRGGGGGFGGGGFHGGGGFRR